MGKGGQLSLSWFKPKSDNYKGFQFDLFLENLITLFVSCDVINFETIENNGNFS